MSKAVLIFFFVVLAPPCWAQNEYFSMGTVSLQELEMLHFPMDTLASAVYLREFGYASISNDDKYNLIFEYHAKIKILKREAFNLGNFEIPLSKSEDREERVLEIKATTYNMNGQSLVATPMAESAIFKESANQSLNRVKFTLPDIRVGTVIDVYYKIESPFVFNFWPWHFQSEYPKIESEYWASIPGNYVYNIVLKGYLPLFKSEQSIRRDCLSDSHGGVASCAFLKYAMRDVPAFRDEEYMTARKNFLSAILFELVEIRAFTGAVYKYTKEWKDVEEELRTHADFGAQIRRAKNLASEKILPVAAMEKTELGKATKIWRTLAATIHWNGSFGKYSELGVRKAYDLGRGNIGDINLALVAAYQEAGFEADPVLLSTRENGWPRTIHPVLSDFNYVIARVKVGDQFYLVDASEPSLPFGLIPERCLNGSARLLKKGEGEWIDLTPKGKDRQVAKLDVVFNSDRQLIGTLEVTTYDYAASYRRKKLASAENQASYRRSLEDSYGLTILSYINENQDNFDLPLVERMEVQLESASSPSSGPIYLEPHLIGTWKENPFRSNERLYPVDFGAPLERLYMINVTLPEGMVIEGIPANVLLGLPENGGRFSFSVSQLNGKLATVSKLQVNKTVYSSEQYHSLKELFNRVIALQQSVVTLTKK